MGGIIISQLAFAQYFDWVKVYKGSEADGFSNNSNQILNVKTDSFGNSYFVGCCAYDAGFNGERFLPITPNGPFCNTICTVIGKISSDGDLLWSKVIHANNNKNHSTKDIFILGDTALGCFINVLLPIIYYPNESLPLNYLYYLW